MKVKCIDDNNWYLTIGKIYETIGEYKYSYQIRDDDGDICWPPKEYFRILSEIRNETINKLLENES